MTEDSVIYPFPAAKIFRILREIWYYYYLAGINQRNSYNPVNYNIFINEQIVYQHFSAIVSFCLFTLSAQQDKVVKSIIQIGQTDNQTMNHLDVLSNRIGGRLIGSDAYENAALWCAAQFKKWGMEVEMDEAGTLPVGFNRGPWFGRMLSENGMDLHFATPSYTSGTKGVQRGHVVH